MGLKREEELKKMDSEGLFRYVMSLKKVLSEFSMDCYYDDSRKVFVAKAFHFIRLYEEGRFLQGLPEDSTNFAIRGQSAISLNLAIIRVATELNVLIRFMGGHTYEK